MKGQDLQRAVEYEDRPVGDRLQQEQQRFQRIRGLGSESTQHVVGYAATKVEPLRRHINKQLLRRATSSATHSTDRFRWKGLLSKEGQKQIFLTLLEYD